ncbi:MAG TPA: NAD(P)H-hydrate dehydratase [Clostridiales bacterium]|nr:NAD(P)H-hydrate dehydratase [Clostridiales bacterium]
MFVVTPSHMRQIDQRAINEFGIPGIVLMENAALRAVKIIMDRYPLPRCNKVTILAGSGNNGGDGLAIARHLFLSGYRVKVLVVCGRGRLPSGDAGINLQILQKLKTTGVYTDPGQYASREMQPLCLNSSLEILYTGEGQDLYGAIEAVNDAALIVDALFGTGLDRPVTGLYAAIIDEVNKTGIPVLSIDIPSGINGETGQVMGTAVRAADTVTFGYYKLGHLLFPGRNHCGRVHVVPISLPGDSAQSTGVNMFTLNDREASQMLRIRPRDGHKGTFGKVAVIAGSTGLTGAAYLASQAALRSGAGLVTLGIPADLNPIMEEKLTEVMTFPLEDGGHGHLTPQSLKDVCELIEGKDVLAIGPGLGKNPGVFEILWNIFGKFNISIVIDADGLNHISKDMKLLQAHCAPVIVTPHPGEMSRMTGLAVDEIIGRPIETASQFASEYDCIVLLKGAASIVAEPGGRIYVNASGNSGMAKGGSGDVLTGMIASLLAQGYGPFEAAVLGCYIHGRAGDDAARLLGETGMTPVDMIDAIPRTFQRLYKLKTEAIEELYKTEA